VAEAAARIRPLAFILCDDIRREISGKDIYIGVYTADIVVPQLPFDLPIALALLFEPLQIGKASVFMEVIPPGSAGHFAIGVDANVAVDNPGEDASHQNLSIVLNGIPLRITQEGDLLLKARPADTGDWELIRRVFVRRGVPPGPQVPTVLPIVPEQPA
jgi:hypothetical protein